jgi:hypothetical protein
MVRDWAIRTPHVYRVMERRCIDDFFATGALRLSSFIAFRQHQDEYRGDAGESDAQLLGSHENAHLYVIDVSPPLSAYVVCGATVYNHLGMKKFGNGCMRIFDTLGFASAIASEIPYFRAGMEGFCIYQNERSLRKQFASPEGVGIVPAEGGGQLKISADLFNGVNSPDRYFLKLMRYSAQAEYRWIWQAGHQNSPVLDIVCPEARQFCDLIDVPTGNDT